MADVVVPEFTKNTKLTWKSTRLHIGLLLMFGMFCGTSMRVNLSMAIVCMVNFTIPENPTTNSTALCSNNLQLDSDSKNVVHGQFPTTFSWTSNQISMILSAVFYGSLFSCWWSGFIADKFGPKIILLVAIIFFTILTLLTPFIAGLNFYAIFVARFFIGICEGVIYPCTTSISSKWFPKFERSTFAAIYTSGNQLAAILAMIISSFLCKTNFGWPAIFYFFGGIGIIWIILWIVFASNSAENNRFITAVEAEFIKKSISNNEKSSSVPWLKMATSTVLFANIVANFTFGFSAALLQTYLPTYLKQILKLEIGKSGLLAMLPFIAQLLGKNILGIFSDFLKKKNFLTTTQATKVFEVLGNVGTISCCLILAFFINCNTLFLAIIIFGLQGFFCSFNIPGYFTSLLSIAPPFTGTLFSISMFAGNIGNALSPTLVGILNKNGTNEEWQKIWLISAVLNSFAAICFLIFGSAELQDWGKTAEKADSSNEMNLNNLQQTERMKPYVVSQQS